MQAYLKIKKGVGISLPYFEIKKAIVFFSLLKFNIYININIYTLYKNTILLLKKTSLLL